MERTTNSTSALGVVRVEIRMNAQEAPGSPMKMGRDVEDGTQHRGGPGGSFRKRWGRLDGLCPAWCRPAGPGGRCHFSGQDVCLCIESVPENMVCSYQIFIYLFLVEDNFFNIV